MIELKKIETAMIGSMPHKTPEEALKLLLNHPLSIPTWPQLPKRSFKEAMITQYSEGFPGIIIDEEKKKVELDKDNDLIASMTLFYEAVVSENINFFSISEEHAAGFHYFLNELKNKKTKFPLIKGQITGPFSFGLGLNDRDGKAVWFDQQYKDIVLKGLTMKALWQVKELSRYGDKVIIFLDEPILSALGTPAYMSVNDEEVISSLNEIIRAIQKADAAVGIHCCGNMDWGLLTKTDVDIIAFDAYDYGEKVALYPDEITSFLGRGGILAWGIVPTVSTGNDAKIFEETENKLQKKLKNTLELFVKKGISEKQIRKQMILTPSCGIGSLSVEAAECVLDLLGKIKL